MYIERFYFVIAANKLDRCPLVGLSSQDSDGRVGSVAYDLFNKLQYAPDRPRLPDDHGLFAISGEIRIAEKPRTYDGWREAEFIWSGPAPTWTRIDVPTVHDARGFVQPEQVKEPAEVTLYVLHTEEDQHRTPENALEEFKSDHRYIHEVTLPGGEDAEVRAACKVWGQIEDYHSDGDAAFFLVAKSDDGEGLMLVETCVGVTISYGGEITGFDPLPDDEDDGPVVCGGCLAVGPEPHAADCIDERIRKDEQDRYERGERNDPTDDLGDDNG